MGSARQISAHAIMAGKRIKKPAVTQNRLRHSGFYYSFYMMPGSMSPGLFINPVKTDQYTSLRQPEPESVKQPLHRCRLQNPR